MFAQLETTSKILDLREFPHLHTLIEVHRMENPVLWFVLMGDPL